MSSRRELVFVPTRRRGGRAADARPTGVRSGVKLPVLVQVLHATAVRCPRAVSRAARRIREEAETAVEERAVADP